MIKLEWTSWQLTWKVLKLRCRLTSALLTRAVPTIQKKFCRAKFRVFLLQRNIRAV